MRFTRSLKALTEFVLYSPSLLADTTEPLPLPDVPATMISRFRESECFRLTPKSLPKSRCGGPHFPASHKPPIREMSGLRKESSHCSTQQVGRRKEWTAGRWGQARPQTGREREALWGPSEAWNKASPFTLSVSPSSANSKAPTHPSWPDDGCDSKTWAAIWANRADDGTSTVSVPTAAARKPPAPRPPRRECGAHAPVFQEAKESRGCAARRHGLPQGPRDSPVLAPPRPRPGPTRRHRRRGRRSCSVSGLCVDFPSLKSV